MRSHPQLVSMLLHRGAVWLLWRQDFPNGIRRSKYCVVMEDYDESLSQTIVVLTTSRLEFSYRPSTAIIPDGTLKGLEGPSLVDLENYVCVDFRRFCDEEETKYIGDLPAPIMAEIERALLHANLPDEILIRMRPIKI